jgi:hypothetical protein
MGPGELRPTITAQTAITGSNINSTMAANTHSKQRRVREFTQALLWQTVFVEPSETKGAPTSNCIRIDMKKSRETLARLAKDSFPDGIITSTETSSLKTGNLLPFPSAGCAKQPAVGMAPSSRNVHINPTCGPRFQSD